MVSSRILVCSRFGRKFLLMGLLNFLVSVIVLLVLWLVLRVVVSWRRRVVTVMCVLTWLKWLIWCVIRLGLY